METETETKSTEQVETKEERFQRIIKEYVEKHSPKLYILTPCYGGMCFINYVHSLMATKELFDKYKIPLIIEFCKNDSLVSRARNNLIAKAMSDVETTHMLFIDADITWSPMDIIKLLLANKPLVGGVYPLKRYFFDKIIPSPTNPNPIQKILERKKNSQFSEIISDTDMIEHNLLKYNINYLEPTLSIDQNLAKVKHLATGFMMIRRDCIEKMSQAFPSTKYTDDVGYLYGSQNDYAYALFDCGVEEGHYLSEDWLFCHRWKKMGGSIWIDVTINLTHTGNTDYKGSYLSSII